ncbi:hypothetical protein ACIBL6_41900 [Streptomyces sp. NPDC050400]|uniref:hypothetical protein n=1 Tax=Streptomyces sp. NPDC050400 TaxID=3365610 RepID=UPI0037B21C7A
MSGTHAAHHIEVTAEGLQEDLARLEVQKHALERELAAVVAHLGSVQRALGALHAVVETVAPESDEESGHKKYGKLTEQILDYFTEVGGADVRARDVAAALGRATDNGSINAVRSTLDRLVATSRVRRAGRGLYRAA